MRLRPSAQISYFSWKVTLWIGAIHILALGFMVPYFSWSALAAFFIMYYVSGMLGITFGFHRLLTHKSFKAPVWMENAAAFCGTLACQGEPVSWVGEHRVHHAYSDKEGDPHDSTKGFWYSHCGWLINRRKDVDDYDEVKHYAPDLAKRPFMVWLDKNMILVQVIVGLSLMGLGGVVTDVPGFDWHNGFAFIVWGVFVRLMALYHVTWFVNSASHIWGSRPNESHDNSANNWWVGLLAFGEGWHNNHHAQQRSARHGWNWWQFDQTWILIRTLEVLGLVKDVKRPVFKEARVSPAAASAGMSARTERVERKNQNHTPAMNLSKDPA